MRKPNKMKEGITKPIVLWRSSEFDGETSPRGNIRGAILLSGPDNLCFVVTGCYDYTLTEESWLLSLIEGKFSERKLLQWKGNNSEVEEKGSRR